MNEVWGTVALRDAVAASLEMGGMGLLEQPKVFYSMLLDLAKGAKLEIQALRMALVDREDAGVLMPLTGLRASSSLAEVEKAILLVEQQLIRGYLLNEGIAQSCARGLGEGVAAHLGIAIKGRGGKGPGGEATAAASPPPNATILLDVPADKLASGWRTTKSIRFARAGVFGDRPESVDIVVPPGSRGGDVLTVRGRGHYGASGERGDLLVTLCATAAASPPPKAAAKGASATVGVAASKPARNGIAASFLWGFVALFLGFVIAGILYAMLASALGSYYSDGLEAVCAVVGIGLSVLLYRLIRGRSRRGSGNRQ